ncbi:MAG: hypothetical protein COB09_08065 [Thalassobium sp.]|nr:MAG: hypothetical protein COB09_08065 [Thalassobium sp.]
MNFMGGLMQGASFVNGMQQQQRANDRADEQFAMQKEQFGMEKEDRENKQLLVDFDRETRALAEAGKAPDQGFWKKYSGLGINKLESDEQREEMMQAGTLMHRAVSENKWDERALDGINLMLKDDLAARTKTDGMARRIIGAKELPTGKDADGDGVEDVRMVPILEVTKSDGTKYTAPLTRNGTGDPDDDIYTINDQKINEWHEAALHRANMAYNLQRHKNDPKAFTAALREIVLGRQERGDGYEVRDIYDEATGTKRAAAIRKSDAQFSHWLGGASVNDGRGGSGSGRGGKTGVFDVDGYLKMQQEIRTSANFTTPEERAAAAAEVDRDIAIKWGVPPEVVLQAHQLKRQSGDYSELTHEDVAQVMAGIEARQRAEVSIDNAMTANPEVFGRPGLQQVEQQIAQTAQPPMPNQIDRRVTAQIQELEAKAADPRYPENARVKFQAEAEELRGKNTVAASAPPTPKTPRDRREQRIERLQQMIAAGPDSLKAAEYAKEMAQLMAANNSSSRSADLAGL